jgi:hypothetical protein
MAGDKSFQLDFYVCANRNSPAALEIKKTLPEAGYSVYLPPIDVEPELDRIAKERFKAIALVLTGDSEQTRLRAHVAKKTVGFVLAVFNIASRPSADQTSARSFKKPAEKAVREPTGRPLRLPD